MFQIFNISRVWINKDTTSNCSKSFVRVPSNIFTISDVRIERICFKDVPIHVLVFSKYFGDEYGVGGSRFSWAEMSQPEAARSHQNQKGADAGVGIGMKRGIQKFDKKYQLADKAIN